MTKNSKHFPLSQDVAQGRFYVLEAIRIRMHQGQGQKCQVLTTTITVASILHSPHLSVLGTVLPQAGTLGNGRLLPSKMRVTVSVSSISRQKQTPVRWSTNIIFMRPLAFIYSLSSSSVHCLLLAFKQITFYVLL